MDVLIAIGLVLMFALGVASGAGTVLVLCRKKKRSFPSVVELARPAVLPRLGFKIASLTARNTAKARIVPGVAPIPFAMIATPPPPADPLIGLPANQPVTDPPLSTPEPAPRSVYEVGTSPYAAPIVKGARISLPGDQDADLPIRFRSAHPGARPIAEAGDTAERIQIVADDGRIHMGHDAPIAFGPPTD